MATNMTKTKTTTTAAAAMATMTTKMADAVGGMATNG